MKATIDRDVLNAGLATVARALPSRNTIPILQNVLLSTDQGRLRLTATDLEKSIAAWLAADIEEEGAIAVPGRLLAAIVDSLGKGDIRLSPAKGTNALALSAGGYSGRIAGYAADDFPPLPEVEGDADTAVEAGALRDLIGRVVFCAATDQSRPVLTAAHCRFEGDRLTMGASDGWRAATGGVGLAMPIAEPVEALIPARTLAEVARLPFGEGEILRLAITPARVGVAGAAVEIVSQLVTGNFPDFRQLIPTGHSTAATADRDALLAAVKRAEIFGRDVQDICRLSPTRDALKVWTVGAEIGDGADLVPAEVGGSDNIASNANFLAEALAAVPGERVRLEWGPVGGGQGPMAFRADPPGDWTALVMPMFAVWPTEEATVEGDPEPTPSEPEPAGVPA